MAVACLLVVKEDVWGVKEVLSGLLDQHGQYVLDVNLDAKDLYYGGDRFR